MWDLPRPGLEPVSPALAGGFLTTLPPGKPLKYFNKNNTCSSLKVKLQQWKTEVLPPPSPIPISIFQSNHCNSEQSLLVFPFIFVFFSFFLFFFILDFAKCFHLFFFLYWSIVDLQYHVSFRLQHSDSAICVCVCVYFFRFFSLIGYY